MKKEIWVFAEANMNGQATPVYKELLCKATELSQQIEGSAVCSVIIGNNVESLLKEVSESGISKVYVVEHEKLADYNSENYAIAFESLITKYSPEMILIGATALGSELAPTVAAKVKTGLAAHCVDIRVDGDKVNNMVPAFGGRVLSEIYIPDVRPMMASIRSGILESYELAMCDSVEIVKEDASYMDSFIAREELLEFKPNVVSGRQLENAKVVIGVGRGIATDESWDNVQKFADRLDAPIGCTRSFVDMGKVPDESSMIGTSGKSVKPEVFIGFGISGAAHYICGMNKSKLIISINKDENAKMFNFSDYGVIGDVNIILPALLAKF